MSSIKIYGKSTYFSITFRAKILRQMRKEWRREGVYTGERQKDAALLMRNYPLNQNFCRPIDSLL
jgi:hypothetical protein